MQEHAFRKEEREEAVDRESSTAPRPVEVIPTHLGPFSQTKPQPQPLPQPRRYAISLFWNIGFKITRPKRPAVAPGKKAQADVEPTPWNQDRKV